VIIGTCAGVTFWLFHIPYPMILGLVIALTNIIPYFGPFIGAIPAVLIAAAISSKAVIVILVTIAVLQFIEGNILGPLIVGKSLNMHPVAIMLVLLAGGELAGVLGMIIAVPAASILKITFTHLIAIRTDN
jgi:predicted PurR-regulated permease PerM